MASPKSPRYAAYSYRSDPRHRQLEVDSVACKRQWHTERRCAATPLKVNDAEPSVDATVVLARYEEDCSWILSYPRCRFVVYNKGSPLPPEVLAHGRLEVVEKPNRGREGSSYIDYVREHYDDLPEVVVFSQVDPVDKVPDFYGFLDDVLDGSAPVDGYVGVGTMKFVPKWMANHPAHGVVQMYHALFAAGWDYDLFFPHGATMAVSRGAVLARSPTFWTVAHYLVDHDHGGVAARHAGHPENADATWGFEKCWPVVFDGGRTPSNPLEPLAPPPGPPADYDEPTALREARARAARLDAENAALKKALDDLSKRERRKHRQASLETMVVRPTAAAYASPPPPTPPPPPPRREALAARVHQDDMTAGSGNALQACVCSLVGAALEAAPNFVKEPSYEAAIGAFLAPRNLRAEKIKLPSDGLARFAGRLAILRGKSPRGDFGHVVVARCSGGNGADWAPVFDPHPDSTFLSRDEPYGWAMFFEAC